MRGKTHNLVFRPVDRDKFDAIKSGRKKVETRAARAPYRDIAAGDTVRLVCGRDRFLMTVKSAMKFRTIAAMLRRYPARAINPKVGTAVGLRKMYYGFPGYRENIRKFGLIVMELEPRK